MIVEKAAGAAGHLSGDTAIGSRRAATAPVWGEAAPHMLGVWWRMKAAQPVASPPFSLAQPFPPLNGRGGWKGSKLAWEGRIDGIAAKGLNRKI